MEFKDKLQLLRKEKNYTQTELAKLLYVSRAAISKWETGKGNPNIESLLDISELFDISINDLLSSEQLLSIAVTNNRKKMKEFSLFGYSIIDLLSFLMMFLPLFGVRVGTRFIAVSIFGHTQENVVVSIIYYFVFISLFLLSIGQFIIGKYSILINKQHLILIFSSIFSVFSLLVFIVTNEPYISFFLTFFLIGKVLFLFNYMLQKR